MTVSSLKQRKMIHFSKSFQCWTNKSKVRSCRHCYALITSQDTAYISIKKLLLQTLGDIQQLRGPNSTHFWPSPPSSEQTWTFYMPSTLCHLTRPWTFYWPSPPSSCPRTYWMPPCSKNSDRPQKDTLQKQMFQASGNICLFEYRKCFHIWILMMTVWAFFTSKYNCMGQRSIHELF